MRHLLTILALTTLSFASFGQRQSIDTFISRITNQQVVVMMQYVWYPKMFSPAGDSLIKIGKPATDKLIPLLSDTSKGIIVHYILSNIWADKLEKDGQNLGSNVHQVDNDTPAVLGILYTDFVFYQDNNRWNFARQVDLENNKRRWTSFLQTNTFKQRQPIGSK
jgi:hypothetical protein